MVKVSIQGVSSAVIGISPIMRTLIGVSVAHTSGKRDLTLANDNDVAEWVFDHAVADRPATMWGQTPDEAAWAMLEHVLHGDRYTYETFLELADIVASQFLVRPAGRQAV